VEPINLEKLREQNIGQQQRDLFQHQIDALDAMKKVFDFADNTFKGALLVLPTGAGKTYTAVRWLNDYILPKGVRIIWLAHTFHLLDQAYETLFQNAQWIQGRRTLNVKLISSHPSHEKVSSIDPTSDDIVIMSTQTAIANFNVDALDERGNLVVTNFRKFVENCKETGLLLVLDEAHHAPAYGCRHLLMGIREVVPDLKLLGLTATPTYTDETRRGWLKKIFEQEVVYEAKQADLIAKDILAKPKFISMPTGTEYEVDDKLYNRLVRERKDLPEYIVEKLARGTLKGMTT
jgi:superfamily II DNA or RNA helicase